MRRTVAALTSVALVLTTLGFSASAGAKTATPAYPTVVVIGDSVTARYNNTPGDPLRGWWSWLAGRGKVTIVRKAQSGSGVMNPGYVGFKRCAGNTYGSRTASLAAVSPRPRAVVVEGGRNDLVTCSKKVRSPADAQDAWRRYYRGLRAEALKIGLATKDVYVFSPWGDASHARAPKWRAMQKAAAERYGLTWIETRLLTLDEAPDGVHPDADGSLALYRLIALRSDLDTRFR
ncbi:MAG: SGNH/GDSL hydrolase family protein [Actinomycetales bacterium]|nr:MAG: SGNH/GDSL hydrolase family protein [Actinomycetales bacterium]